MSVVTLAQRGDSFIVQLDGDAERGVERLYEATLNRLYAPLPVGALDRTPFEAVTLSRDAEPLDPTWLQPERDVTDDEIESAERVEPAMVSGLSVGVVW